MSSKTIIPFIPSVELAQKGVVYFSVSRLPFLKFEPLYLMSFRPPTPALRES